MTDVKCGAMWNVAISDMVRLKCNCVEYGGVECGVLVCVMLHNAKCGQ